MRVLRAEQGFTFVELMIVVLIVGVLVSIAIPVLNSAKSATQKSTCWANQRTVEGSAEVYRSVTGSLPAAGVIGSSHVLITGAYLKAVPTCPLTAADYALDTSGTVALASLSCNHGHY